MRKGSIKINITSHLGCDAAIRRLLHKILLDYCKRFDVKVLPKAWKVGIVIADYQNEDGAEGIMTQLDDKIIVQVKDPYMFITKTKPNRSLDQFFLTTLCHEMVHVCQVLTGREGIRLKITQLDDEENELDEEYYFDPAEIEARVLDEMYARYAPPIILEKLQAVEEEGA